MPKEKIKENRIYVFIDAENTRNAAEDSGHEDLDYKKLLNWIHKKKIVKTYIYVGIEQGDSLKINKFNELAKTGYIVQQKSVMAYKQEPVLIPTTCPSCRNNFYRKYYIKDKKKANCDSELTLDAVKTGMENEYDEVMFFTGDGDFCSLMEYIATDLKKKVIVVSAS